MYETEINNAREAPDQIPIDVLRSFEALAGRILSRTVLPWSEHCTECVWPSCYTSCELYSPRQDGRCRRFVDGMVRVDLPAAANRYLLKIRFKRWGKLWTPGNVRLHSVVKAERLERRDYYLGSALRKLPLPSLVKSAVGTKRYSYKKRVAANTANSSALPTCFVLECYNPHSRNVRMSLTMRSEEVRSYMPFQKLIELTPGFLRVRVPMEEITALLDVNAQFSIELVPNEDANETTIYFGVMDFVVEPPDLPEFEKKVKCVVWDLDNTLWDGVLVEDGIENLCLKPEIKNIIQTLDARGILNSIASKNNYEDAWRVIEKFKLEEYFLYPQICWQPKSEAIKEAAGQLNIGLDTILFIDDSGFEREEVKAACSQVRVLDGKEYRSLAHRQDCMVPTTAESQQRRKLYQIEMSRKELSQGFSNDYMAFLRHCQIRLFIKPMTEESLERVHELTQRTNQMNFSGNRYDREMLRSILSNPNLDTFVLSCEDRFGSYGVIGFSIVDRREPRMTDLMFSCRVQSKRVEHAFLSFVIRKYTAENHRDFYADYRKTSRNAPSGQVFDDLAMEVIEICDGVSRLKFSKKNPVPDHGVIEIVLEDSQVANQA